MVCFLRLPVTICVWRRSVLKLLLGPNNLFKSRSDQTGTMWSHKKHWWKLVYGKIVQINVTWQQVGLPGNHGFSIFFLIAPVASFANEIYSGLRFLPARNCSKLGKDSDDCSPLSSRKRSVFFSPSAWSFRFVVVNQTSCHHNYASHTYCNSHRPATNCYHHVDYVRRTLSSFGFASLKIHTETLVFVFT